MNSFWAFSNLAPFKWEKHQGMEVLRDDWTIWKERFENALVILGETDPKKLKAILLLFGGVQLHTLFRNLSIIDPPEDEAQSINPYEAALQKLDNYFAPKRPDHLERYIFRSMKPEANESPENFFFRLCGQSMWCNFGGSEESRSIAIIDKFVLEAPCDLRRMFFEADDHTLAGAREILKTYEMNQMIRKLVHGDKKSRAKK
uniref:Uncharacterized protein n=1 Tax=Lutzomyia longipalpis TaxID=7200 RepID=A0A1B0CBV4_LUTLO